MSAYQLFQNQIPRYIGSYMYVSKFRTRIFQSFLLVLVEDFPQHKVGVRSCIMHTSVRVVLPEHLIFQLHT